MYARPHIVYIACMDLPTYLLCVYMDLCIFVLCVIMYMLLLIIRCVCALKKCAYIHSSLRILAPGA